jgi:single-strand DNA-binding protein
MSDVNNCTFSGRLTADAERKTVGSGAELVSFDLACNTGWGEYKKTLYLTCSLWGKAGTGVYPYLKKGKAAAVCGQLIESRWTGQADGLEHKKLEVNCRDCILLSDGGPRGTSEDAPAPEKKEYGGEVEY